MKQNALVEDRYDDQGGEGRVMEGYFATNRHGSGAQNADVGKVGKAASQQARHGLLHVQGWSNHAAAAESVEQLWVGRGQAWLHDTTARKRHNYLSSSEDTGDAPALSPPGSSMHVEAHHNEQQDHDTEYLVAPVADDGRKSLTHSSFMETEEREKTKEAKISSSVDIESPDSSLKKDINLARSGEHCIDSPVHRGPEGVQEEQGTSGVTTDRTEEFSGNTATSSPYGSGETKSNKKNRERQEVRELVLVQEDGDSKRRKIPGLLGVHEPRYPPTSYTVDDLNRAIIKRNDMLFKTISSSLLDLNPRGLSTMAPLICACRHGNTSMVAKLLDYGAVVNSVDHVGKTPIMYAIEQGNLDMVKVLLENGSSMHTVCNKGLTALHYAVENDCDDITKLLIHAGSSVDYRAPPHQKTALMKASISGKADIVCALVAAKASCDLIDNQGHTALISCLAKGIRSKKILSRLIEAGTIESLDRVDNEGKSALVHALTNRITFAAEMLLKKGCEFTQFCPFSSTYPLILAIQCEQHSCVSWMLRHGANPDSSDLNCKTALMYAAERGYGQMVADLINAGACVYTIDQKIGFSALDYAAYNGHKQSARILLKEEGKKVPEEEH